ncbi:hypothetical protein B0H17DRAFT_1210432 [Mycena rosella]|uniref:Protein kinase domain-containing protein n=1 Tax=Mycena rosella TaxID=1033263 RepID=A0AAD7G8V1_MYCRO|nr:hypothetical protein B0H17DRAFT_1210432 [Mycena rosella]
MHDWKFTVCQGAVGKQWAAGATPTQHGSEEREIFRFFEEGVAVGRQSSPTRHQSVEACPPVTRSDAADLVRTIFTAVKYIRAAGSVHRDLKPENLFRTTAEDADIMIADFGLSRIMEAD